MRAIVIVSQTDWYEVGAIAFKRLLDVTNFLFIYFKFTTEIKFTEFYCLRILNLNYLKVAKNLRAKTIFDIENSMHRFVVQNMYAPVKCVECCV